MLFQSWLVFEVQISVFNGMWLQDENRRQEEQEWKGNIYLRHFFDHQIENETYVIWALTAGVLIKAASVIYQRLPAFEERRPPFWSISNRWRYSCDYRASSVSICDNDLSNLQFTKDKFHVLMNCVHWNAISFLMEDLDYNVMYRKKKCYGDDCLFFSWKHTLVWIAAEW